MTPQYQNIGVGLIKYSSLMGIFLLSNLPPISQSTSMNMISTSTIDKRKVHCWFEIKESFWGNLPCYSNHQWPHHQWLFVGGFRYLSPTVLAITPPPPPPSLDYLSHTLPYDESIMKVMSLDEMPWKDHHHRYSFLPHFHMVEEQFASVVSSYIITSSVPDPHLWCWI